MVCMFAIPNTNMYNTSATLPHSKLIRNMIITVRIYPLTWHMWKQVTKFLDEPAEKTRLGRPRFRSLKK